MRIEAMKQALADAQSNERHGTVAETRYWFSQYKQLAKQAIAEAEKQTLSSRINDARVHADHDKQRDEAREMIAEAEKQEPVTFELYHHIVLKLAEAGCKLSEQQKMVLCNLKAVTSPPQRQPLTGTEVLKMILKHGWLCSRTLGDAYMLGLRDAEAAHGIKGEAC